MNSVKTLAAVVMLSFIFISPAISENQREKDFAVPGVSDLPILGTQNPMTQVLMEKQLSPFTYSGQKQWLDINRDLQLNDFDTKQFQAVVERLNGQKLTGLQLIIRFQEAQKNQDGPFPVVYDLDRDGMFTTYDVDAFTRLVNGLDEGASRGSELIQKFRDRIFPQRNK